MRSKGIPLGKKGIFTYGCVLLHVVVFVGIGCVLCVGILCASLTKLCFYFTIHVGLDTYPFHITHLMYRLRARMCDSSYTVAIPSCWWLPYVWLSSSNDIYMGIMLQICNCALQRYTKHTACKRL